MFRRIPLSRHSTGGVAVAGSRSVRTTRHQSCARVRPVRSPVHCMFLPYAAWNALRARSRNSSRSSCRELICPAIPRTKRIPERRAGDRSRRGCSAEERSRWPQERLGFRAAYRAKPPSRCMGLIVSLDGNLLEGVVPCDAFCPLAQVLIIRSFEVYEPHTKRPYEQRTRITVSIWNKTPIHVQIRLPRVS
jgi:hypothetical protein